MWPRHQRLHRHFDLQIYKQHTHNMAILFPAFDTLPFFIRFRWNFIYCFLKWIFHYFFHTRHFSIPVRFCFVFASLAIANLACICVSIHSAQALISIFYTSNICWPFICTFFPVNLMINLKIFHLKTIHL